MPPSDQRPDHGPAVDRTEANANHQPTNSATMLPAIQPPALARPSPLGAPLPLVPSSSVVTLPPRHSPQFHVRIATTTATGNDTASTIPTTTASVRATRIPCCPTQISSRIAAR